MVPESEEGLDFARGVRNTEYFYRKTIQRRRINRIETIEYQLGQWLHDERGIKKHVVEFFSGLYI